MLFWEFTHAREAIESGIYVNWRSNSTKGDCTRIGKFSMCMCGHFHSNHSKVAGKGKKNNTKCTECACTGYQFVPRRPEELGQWWLVRRKGFDINTWKPPCICKHHPAEHSPKFPYKCKCGCFAYASDWVCINCD